jgi:PAS domain S-box-containing protein
VTPALKLARATDYGCVAPSLPHHPAPVDGLARVRAAAPDGAIMIAEERPQAVQAPFRTTLADAPIGIGVFDLDGQWLQVNRELCAIVGYSQQEMLEVTFQDLTHPDDLTADRKRVHAMLAGEIGCYELEKRCLRRDGTVLWIRLSVALVRDANGEPWHFAARIEDLTAAKPAVEAWRVRR